MSLTIYPAIDLKGGQVVRLAQGEMASATVYADDPAGQAARFAAAGADHLHVVDLDGAFAGRAVHAEAVEAIVKAFPARSSSAAASAHGRRSTPGWRSASTAW
jgi:phosphoribosylformimino-5-aminoimidazole carboxamide ribotide isomerase